MPQYKATIDGKEVTFDAANDAAAGAMIDAKQIPSAADPGKVDPKLAGEVSALLGSEGPIPQAREQGRAAGRTAGSATSFLGGAAEGAGRNFQDEVAAYGAVSGMPEWMSAVPGLGLARAGVGAAREAMGVPAGDRDRELARIRGMYEGMNEAHPAASLAGNVTGGVATDLPFLATGPVGGAIEGALSGAGAGEDEASRAIGAGAGATVGAALPFVAGRVIKPGLDAIGTAMINRGWRGGAENVAEGQVGRALRQDWAGQSPAQRAQSILDLQRSYASGQAGEMVGGDIGGETTRALARKAANESPEARQLLTEATTDRFNSQASRAANWWGRLTGDTDAVVRRQGLEEAARAANRPAYERAYAQGQSVWDDNLQSLTTSDTVRKAIKDVTRTSSDYAAGRGQRQAVRNPFQEAADGTLTLPEGVTPSLEFWDHVQRNLRAASEAAPRGGEEAARIGSLRRLLNENLDAAVPDFANARRGAAAWFGAEDALEAGTNFLKNPRGSSTEVRQQLARMSTADRTLFREGVEDYVMREIRALPDGRDISKMFNNPEVRDRLRVGLGDQRAQDLVDYLRVERGMNNLKNALGNSTTARQLLEAGIIGGGVGGAASLQFDTDPTSSMGMGAAVATGLSLMAKNQKSRLNENVSRHVGRLLSSQDPADIMRALNTSRSSPAVNEAVQKYIERLLTIAPAQQAGHYMGSQQ